MTTKTSHKIRTPTRFPHCAIHHPRPRPGRSPSSCPAWCHPPPAAPRSRASGGLPGPPSLTPPLLPPFPRPPPPSVLSPMPFLLGSVCPGAMGWSGGGRLGVAVACAFPVIWCNVFLFCVFAFLSIFFFDFGEICLFLLFFFLHLRAFLRLFFLNFGETVVCISLLRVATCHIGWKVASSSEHHPLVAQGRVSSEDLRWHHHVLQTGLATLLAQLAGAARQDLAWELCTFFHVPGRTRGRGMGWQECKHRGLCLLFAFFGFGNFECSVFFCCFVCIPVL